MPKRTVLQVVNRVLREVDEAGATVVVAGADRLHLSLYDTMRDALEVLGSQRFSWLRKSDDFNTTAAYTTGEVEVTEGDETVAGTDTVWTAAMVGRRFRVTGDTESYEVATFTSATSIELDQPYVNGDDDELSYSIFDRVYSLASDCDRADVMIQTEFGTPGGQFGSLTRMAINDLQTRVPDLDSDTSGMPLYFCGDIGRDSNGYRQVLLYPHPTTAMRIEYWYFPILTDPAADTTTIDIPADAFQYVHWKCLETGYRHTNDTNASYAFQMAEKILDDLIRKDRINQSEGARILPQMMRTTWRSANGRSGSDFDRLR